MRKNLLFVFLMILVGGAAHAQIGKGQKYVGGSFNYNYDSYGYNSVTSFSSGTSYYSNSKITSFQVNPDLGFFLSDKWAIGIQPGYSRTSGTEQTTYIAVDPSDNYVYPHKYHSDAISLGVHFRYYYMLNDKVGIFPQFGVTTAHDVNNLKSGSLSVGGNPNIVFFATPKLGINMGIGNLVYSYDYQTHNSSFNIGLNTNINFGVNYYWGAK